MASQLCGGFRWQVPVPAVISALVKMVSRSDRVFSRSGVVGINHLLLDGLLLPLPDG
jgi:hypothetical protein